MARTTVADVLIDGLARAGAARIFSGPRAPDPLRATADRHGVAAVEAPGAMSAVVLAAVTGEVGEGPGGVIAALDDAPGLVRGLAHAQRDRTPLIVLTPAGADAGLLAPVVKASLAVDAASAGHWIAHAANLAMTDPRGPVHLAVDDAVADRATLPVATACRPAPLPPPEPTTLEALGAALASANRPLLITGLECGADDARWIRSFAETLPAPVLATTKGKGALADPHPLALGALTADHPALARADLVVLLGVDAGELPPGVLPRATRIAHIGRARWPDVAFAAEAIGDLALVIEELAPTVRGRPAADWDVAEVDRIKRGIVRAASATPAGRTVALAREAAPAEVLATGDVPAFAAWQAVAPRQALSPLGAVPGYALLAAVAIGLQRPERAVVAVTSPSGLRAGEAMLVLAERLALALTVVVLDAGAAMPAPAGIEPSVCRDEAGFARAFSRALLDGRLAVVAFQPEGG
jgi:acetolactate synthase-1/2/3 large subunit